MNVVAIVMLGVTGAISAALWWQVDPRRHAIGTATAIAALAVPSVVLAAAAAFALTGDATSDLERSLAVGFGAISAVTGGGVVATCVLRLADRFAGDRDTPAGPVPPPPPPPPAPSPEGRPDPTEERSGGMSVTPGSMSPTGITTTIAGSAPIRDTPDHTTVSDPDTLRGGAWIGALERLAIVATLVTRWPEGLAVILAVKGLGRYPELRRPAAAERFIIGTLASALWAIACVGVVAALGGVATGG